MKFISATSLLVASLSLTTFLLLPQARAGSLSPNQIGLQLYSLRNQFATNTPATLDEVSKFGFHYVELAGTYKLSTEDFRKELDARQLIAVSGHFPYERFRDDVEGVAHDAEILGLKYVGCAWIPHSDPFDEKTCRQAIEVFNQAGKALAKHNLKFFYHSHGYEFQPYQDGTLFDLMMRETNQRYVNFEMDVFWIVHPGQDPVKLLKKYGSRWELMHVKGMKDSTPTGLLTGHTDVNNDVAVGQGKIDYAPILEAGKAAHVKYFIIEDESASSETQIPQSLDYLKKVQW